MEIVVNFFNHGFHGLTRIGKQKKHGVYSLREWSGIFANPHARDLADVFSKISASRQAGRAPCFFWKPILGNFFISRKARKAGPLAKRVSDVFSQSRASSQMSLKKTRHPGKPGVPRSFSECQFLAISSSRARRKKQDRSRSE